jgi:uncharacterized RDD family membrane protein YckC
VPQTGIARRMATVDARASAEGQVGVTGIVTSEAVELEFPDAGIGSRAAALVIDWLLISVTLLLAALGAGFGADLLGVEDWVSLTLLGVTSFVILFGYPIVCEVAFGRSLGKMALGLRVVTREGAPVRFRHAAIRSAFMLVDFVLTFGVGAVAAAAFTRRSQRLGDLAAGTVVLRERHPHGAARAAQFTVPGSATSYAEAIDPTIVDADTYRRIRALLLRADELTDDARTRVAEELAAALRRSTPAPPAEMDDLTFLQVVAAVYQQRPHPRAAGDQVGRSAP